MRSPEVSRFVARLIGAGRRAVDLSGRTAAALDRLEMWWRVEREIRAVAVRSRSMDDLPQWLLDLAHRLGVERPVVDVRRWPASPAPAEGETQ